MFHHTYFSLNFKSLGKDGDTSSDRDCGRCDSSGKALERTLELMNVKVNLIQTETEMITLMRRSKRVPNLYFLADAFGRLERATSLHQNLHCQSVFGKCVILLNDASNHDIIMKVQKTFCY